MSDKSSDVYAPGESVSNRAEQRNEQGQIISELIWNTYGYDNPIANQASLSIAQTLVQLAATWADTKATGAAPPGQVKKS